DPCGDADDRAAHDVGGQQHPVGPDAGQAGRFGVVAGGVQVTAPGGLAQGVGEADVEQQHHEDAGGDVEAAYADGVAGPDQESLVQGDHLALGVDQGE